MNILKTLANNYPDTTVFRKNIIESTARDMGFTGKDFVPLMTKENRVKIGSYDLSAVLPKPEAVPADRSLLRFKFQLVFPLVGLIEKRLPLGSAIIISPE